MANKTAVPCVITMGMSTNKQRVSLTPRATPKAVVTAQVPPGDYKVFNLIFTGESLVAIERTTRNEHTGHVAHGSVILQVQH
jgi:hypothetical protein